MKRIIVLTVVAVSLVAGAFAGGAWAHRPSRARASGSSATTYTCPMHPEYHSDHPGDCPICGMHLEPVRGGSPPDAASPTPGTSSGRPVYVSPERQQAIGMRLGVVAEASGTRTFRTSGRVVSDDNQTYPVVASVNGWIRTVERVSVGDQVKAHQILATFVAPPEFDTAQQAYYDGLEKLYRLAATQPQGALPAHAAEAVERLADALRIMGVSNSQLRAMAKHREIMEDIQVEAPADGVVLKRSAAAGLRFDGGFELFRIADLHRVWILADVYRDQLPFIHPGAPARLTSADASRALAATVSAADPVFDEASLTLKVRLEATNPQAALKPGMFVDVEFPVRFPPALVIPADAIVDSGLRKTVFVDAGDGNFEPRVVETGWRRDGDVEVTKGLAAGERIVVAGTFLVDSESRMKAARP